MKKPIPLLLLALALVSLANAADAPPSKATAAPPAAAAPAPKTAAPAKDASHSHSLKIEVKADEDDTASDAEAAATDTAQTDKDSRPESGDAMVAIGHDQNLESGKRATAVVSVFGSSTAAGDVDDAVVSVLGNTRVTGTVGDAAVAVLGSTYVDGRVGDSVVAVFGNVELGPHADVHGDVVAIGGDLVRDPAAIVHGGVQNVMLFGHMGNLDWLHTWVRNCLMYGRPLAFAPGLGWAWSIAFSFLALYLVLALLFPAGITRCVQTMETQPGRTALAALFTFICKPIVFLLLVITVIGSILVPFLAFALMVAGLFGKAVAFAWIGRRALPARPPEREFRPVLAVLVGGLIVLLIYVVPVLGFIAYKGLDVLGLGMVVYTLILGHRARREAARAAQDAQAAAAPAAGAPGAGDAAGMAAATGDAKAGPAAAAPAVTTATARPAAPPVSLELENRAGFWIRTLALLLDVVLVAIVCSMIRIRIHDAMLLVVAAYGAVMWRLRGTTIGGIVCGLRVVRLDGRAIDWPTAITRALASFLSLFVAGLGFIWVVFDAERQSWHDKIAGTVIVHAPRGTPLV
jgi:uncharacterized RDD family membrane protein YckC